MNQDGGAVLPPDLSRELLWLPDDQLLGGQNEGLLNCFVFTAHILLLILYVHLFILRHSIYLITSILRV